MIRVEIYRQGVYHHSLRFGRIASAIETMTAMRNHARNYGLTDKYLLVII